MCGTSLLSASKALGSYLPEELVWQPIENFWRERIDCNTGQGSPKALTRTEELQSLNMTVTSRKVEFMGFWTPVTLQSSFDPNSCTSKSQAPFRISGALKPRSQIANAKALDPKSPLCGARRSNTMVFSIWGLICPYINILQYAQRNAVLVVAAPVFNSPERLAKLSDDV